MKATKYTCYWKTVLAWICVGSLGYISLVVPMIHTVLAILGIDVHLTLLGKDEIPVPEIVALLIGLGGIHSFDKLKGNLRPDYKDGNDDDSPPS